MLFSSKSNPELISLHIPKTAGTSFRNILKSVYGEREVGWLDMETNGVVRLNEVVYNKNKLPDLKVIHGHFIYDDLLQRFELKSNYKIITWVRDPVNRVISNFYYLESRLKELLDEEKNNLNIISKLQRTLMEYARADINRNRQSKFLAGSKPEDFDFIGVYEFFDQELDRLSSVLNWNSIPEILYYNKTNGSIISHSDEIIDEIRDLNLEDVKLYDEAVKIRITSIGL